MRNLLKIRHALFDVASSTVPDAPITASAWDVSTDSLICAFGPSQDESLVELTRLTVRTLHPLERSPAERPC